MVTPSSAANAPLLLRRVKPVAFGTGMPEGAFDVLIGAGGLIEAVGRDLQAPAEARAVDGNGAFISPGWVDLHTHVWYGGTDISIRPSICGV